MSHVSNVFFHIDIADEHKNMEEIHGWCRENLRAGQTFRKIEDDQVGGSKCLECEIYAAAMNFMDEGGFFDFLCTLYWEFPEDVQYIVMRQDDSRFQIIYPCAHLESTWEGRKK